MWPAVLGSLSLPEVRGRRDWLESLSAGAIVAASVPLQLAAEVNYAAVLQFDGNEFDSAEARMLGSSSGVSTMMCNIAIGLAAAAITVLRSPTQPL